MQPSPTKGYWTTSRVCQHFSCSSRTLFRWMARETNPFPQPRIRGAGSHNRWAINDIEAWEAGEAEQEAA